MFRLRSSEAALPPVLVLQIGWRSGPVAGRSLLRAGFDVVGGHERARLIGRTRYCRHRVRYPSPALDPSGFVDALERICRWYGVRALLPLDDDVVDVLARHSDDVGAIVVGPTASQYEALCDKWHLGDSAVRAGLRTPERAFVGRNGRTDEWPLLPSLVKPRSTSLATAHLAARKPMLVRTAAERDRAVRELVREGVEALVEEQVHGTAWRVHFVRTRDGIALLTLNSVRSFPEHTGQSSVQRVAVHGAPSKLVAGAVRLLDLVDYRGPGSIQAFECGGEIVVHDVNLRLPITVAVSIRAGLDMPRLAVETALGEPLREPSQFVPATYIGLDEVRHLVATVCRRDASTPARKIAADLGRAFIRSDFVLDQVDVTDPVPTLLAARTLGLNLRRDWTRAT